MLYTFGQGKGPPPKKKCILSIIKIETKNAHFFDFCTLKKGGRGAPISMYKDKSE